MLSSYMRKIRKYYAEEYSKHYWCDLWRTSWHRNYDD